MVLFKRHESILLHPEKSMNCVRLHVRVFRMSTSKKERLNTRSIQKKIKFEELQTGRKVLTC
jgi:hypothetical protein